MGSANEPQTRRGVAVRRRIGRGVSFVGSTDHHLLLSPFHPRHDERFRRPPAVAGRPRRSSSWPTRRGPSCWPEPPPPACAADAPASPATRPTRRAARLGVADHGGRPHHQQLAQPLIALARLMPPSRCLPPVECSLRRQAEPGREMPAGVELRRIDGQRQCQRTDRADPRHLRQPPAHRVGLVLRASLRSSSLICAVRCSIAAPSSASIAARPAGSIAAVASRSQQRRRPGRCPWRQPRRTRRRDRAAR